MRKSFFFVADYLFKGCPKDPGSIAGVVGRVRNGALGTAFRVNSSPHSYRSRTPVGSRVKEAPPRTLGTIRNNLSKSTAFQKCRPREKVHVSAASSSPLRANYRRSLVTPGDSARARSGWWIGGGFVRCYPGTGAF